MKGERFDAYAMVKFIAAFIMFKFKERGYTESKNQRKMKL